MPAFRIQGRHFFLTYPQSHFSKESLHTHLCTLTETTTVLVSRELHEDGQPHLHAVASFPRRRDIRDDRFFDYEGRHPNVQRCRSLQAAAEYISKDGDTVGNLGIAEERIGWAGILEQAATKEEFMVLVRQHYPRDYVLNMDRIHSYADTNYKDTQDPSYVNPYPEFAWLLPESVQQWVTNEFPVSITLIPNP